MVLQWLAQTVIFTGGIKVVVVTPASIFSFSPLLACHPFLASIFIQGFKVLQANVFTALCASEVFLFIKLLQPVSGSLLVEDKL